MNNESISGKITHTLFDPLRTWVEASTGNWNMLIVSGFVLLIVGLILFFVYFVKMGKTDERTNKIQLNSTLIMLVVIVLCDVIFPKDYMWQIFFLFKYAFAFIASGIYLAVRYKKDFS
ncbi:DUF2178 domain-containing protein [Halobacillus shinanisalinarum]|uniref:DUF2178 domain-containing protein n=1 Tax=Halobacillus shinanisalinarum TaxID=2932258 RepID=A0ABY4GV82_9BACI|nr:DUF2178 domain-containing protein [Halobacillus shinanisalinarum]UOQ92033.1 DUF2178 domain-containing protein [Halobacillus shinanisalinarum]